MSSSARDQCWLMLPTRRISPLGTCQTVPSIARRRVVRSETASTVPDASPTSTMSPTPNWSSTRMNAPDRKSLTSDCEPKPIATPSMPAPAISGPRSIPTSPRHISAAVGADHEAEHAAQDARERVDALLGAHAGLAGLQQRGGRALAHAPMRSRTAPECSLVSERFTALRPTQFATDARTRIARIFNGGPSSQSATCESFSSSSTVLRT